MISRISDGYLNWLVDKVDGKKGYLELFRALGSREFTWIVKNDENRALDGLALRDHYGYFTGLKDEPCTVLEMLVGLSIRVGEELLWDGSTNYAGIIFWKMIENLRLDTETNNRFDIEYVDDRLYIFLNREYGNDGDGALFRPSHFYPKSQKSWKKLEVWYQMQSWLEDNFE